MNARPVAVLAAALSLIASLAAHAAEPAKHDAPPARVLFASPEGITAGPDARLEPVYLQDAGAAGSPVRPVGYRILSVKPGTVLAGLDLREGDVLKNINGRDLDNAGSLGLAYNEFRHGTRLVVDLLRDGKEIALVYTVP